MTTILGLKTMKSRFVTKKNNTPRKPKMLFWRGFTVLYAVLVTSILLSIGVSIYNISSKQYLLSSSSIDSQSAVYAADAGLECALYWDTAQGSFKSPAPENNPGQSPISCNNSSANLSIIEDTSAKVVTIFTTKLAPDQDTLEFECAVVTITKEQYTDVSGAAAVRTIIESRGYNYCGSNPRKVERALRATYPLE